MSDIVINGKNYDYVDKCSIGDKNYIVFEDDDSIYINEYVVESNELIFKDVELEIQEQVLRKLGIEHE